MIERVPLKRKGIVHLAIECTFCHHWYIKPCDATRSVTCPNMIALQTPKPAKAATKKGKRK